jgi:DNA-binding MarR family transcriptional regulator
MAKQSAARAARSAKGGEVHRGLLPALVGYQLRLAHSAVFAHFAASAGTLGTSPGEFGVLTIIEQNPGLSQTALARAVGVDRSSMVPVIDKLEKMKLVQRRRSDGDRRRYAIHLTRTGGTRLAAMTGAVRAHEAAISKTLSAGERAALVAALIKVREAAG